MLVRKFIRVAVAWLAAIAVPILGVPTGSPWDSMEKGTRQLKVHHDGHHRHSQRFERGAGQGAQSIRVLLPSDIHQGIQGKFVEPSAYESSAAAPRRARYLQNLNPCRYPCLQAEESSEAAPRLARYLHRVSQSQFSPLQSEESLEPATRHVRFLQCISPGQFSPLQTEELLDVSLRQPRYVQVQNVPSYGALPASYMAYNGRPSRSQGSSVLAPLQFTTNGFDDGHVYSALAAKPYGKEAVFNRVEDLPARVYASNPEQLPRLYVFPGVESTSAVESVEQEMPVSLSTPAISESELDDAMRTTAEAEIEEEQDDALRRPAKERLSGKMLKRQTGPTKKKDKSIRKVFRASEVVYRPEVVYDAEGPSPDTSAVKMMGLDEKMLDQEDAQMNHQKTSEEEVTRINHETTSKEEDARMNEEKTSGEVEDDSKGSMDVQPEEDAEEFPMPDTSFGEEIKPSMVKPRSANKDAKVIMDDMDNDEALEGDVVLPESMEDYNSAHEQSAGGLAENSKMDLELAEEKARESTTVKPPEESQLNEDPDLVDDIEDPPTQTMATIDEAPETSTSKN